MTKTVRLLLLCLAISSIAAAQNYPAGNDPSPALPLSHSLYGLLDRFEARGWFEHPLSRIRPYTRLRAARLLQELAARADGEDMSSAESGQLMRARRDLALEILSLGGTDLQQPKNGAGNPIRGEPLYVWSDSNATVVIEPVLRQRVVESRVADIANGVPPDETVSQTYVGATVRGIFAGHFGFRLRHYEARERSTVTRTSRDQILARPIESVQLKGKTVDFRSADFEAVFGAPWFRVDAGKTSHHWGPRLPESDEGLFISPKAPSFGSFRLLAEYGRLTYVHLSGYLRAREGLLDTSRTRDDNGHVRTFLRAKRLAAHRLELRLGKRFLLGLQESVVYGDRGTEILYALPVTVLTAAQSYLNDTDNLMIGADLTALLGSGVRAYAALVLDDLKKFSPGAFSNKYGLQIGLTAVDPFGLPDTDLGIEFLHLEPYLYSHNFDINTYEHFGELLGHSLGPNADAIRLDVRHRFTKAWRAEASVSREREGENPLAANGSLARNVGGDPFQGRRPQDAAVRDFLDGDVQTRLQARLSLAWEPVRDLILEVEYERAHHGNVLLTDGSRGDISQQRGTVTLDLNFY